MKYFYRDTSMTNKILIFFFFLILLSNFAFSQQSNLTKTTGLITGKVFDLSTKKPVEYANVILFSQKDSTQINGTTTDKKGNFVLTGIKPGNYYSSIQFMGYLKRLLITLQFQLLSLIRILEIYI